MKLEDYTKTELIGIVRNYKLNTMGYLKNFNSMKKKLLIDKMRNHPNFNIVESEKDKGRNKEVKFKANKIKGNLKSGNLKSGNLKSKNNKDNKSKKSKRLLTTKELYKTMYNK